MLLENKAVVTSCFPILVMSISFSCLIHLSSAMLKRSCGSCQLSLVLIAEKTLFHSIKYAVSFLSFFLSLFLCKTLKTFY